MVLRTTLVHGTSDDDDDDDDLIYTAINFVLLVVVLVGMTYHTIPCSFDEKASQNARTTIM